MIMGEMKIGQKGQVVIPMMFRKAMNIVPGTKVIFDANVFIYAALYEDEKGRKE